MKPLHKFVVEQVFPKIRNFAEDVKTALGEASDVTNILEAEAVRAECTRGLASLETETMYDPKHHRDETFLQALESRKVSSSVLNSKLHEIFDGLKSYLQELHVTAPESAVLIGQLIKQFDNEKFYKDLGDAMQAEVSASANTGKLAWLKRAAVKMAPTSSILSEIKDELGVPDAKGKNYEELMKDILKKTLFDPFYEKNPQLKTGEKVDQLETQSLTPESPKTPTSPIASM